MNDNYIVEIENGYPIVTHQGGVVYDYLELGSVYEATVICELSNRFYQEHGDFPDFMDIHDELVYLVDVQHVAQGEVWQSAMNEFMALG